MTTLLIESGPGTGKTTTLELAYNYLLTNRFTIPPTREQTRICHLVKSTFETPIASQIVFISFNVSTKDRLRPNIPQATGVYTFGGLGVSCVRRRFGHHELDKARGQKLLSGLLGRNLADLEQKDKNRAYALLKYVEHFKEELLYPNAEAFYTVQEKYGMDALPGGFADLAPELMQQMQQPNGTLEFIDQVWLGLQALQKPIYDLAVIDEGQDLSTLRLEFALKVANHQLVCGDGFQSINAFAGADYQAFDKLKQIATHILPLKTSFRLPTNHITYANTIRPANINPHKTKPGPIEIFPIQAKDSTRLHNPSLPQKITDFLNGHYYNHTTDIFESTIPVHESPQPQVDPYSDVKTQPYLIPLPSSAQDPDEHLIIGRTNAEILQASLVLLRHGIRPRIVRRKEDQDILKNLTDYITWKTNYLKKARKSPTLHNLLPLLKGDMNKAQNMPYRQGATLYEKAKCLHDLTKDILDYGETPEDNNPPQIYLLNNVLANLCKESETSIRLCTIHKAKGLEADFVYILFPPVCHPLAESPADLAQEKNIQFVSETRSKFYKAYVIQE